VTDFLNACATPGHEADHAAPLLSPPDPKPSANPQFQCHCLTTPNAYRPISSARFIEKARRLSFFAPHKEPHYPFGYSTRHCATVIGKSPRRAREQPDWAHLVLKHRPRWHITKSSELALSTRAVRAPQSTRASGRNPPESAPPQASPRPEAPLRPLRLPPAVLL
jgi:hypothetical protein